MQENRNSYQGTQAGGSCRETVCMDTCRVLDSCRDKDCFENVPVRLTDCGQELIERAGNVRAVDASLLGANITVDPVTFNSGFYNVTVRFFVRIAIEACLGQTRPQSVDGLCVCEKQAILYGGEGNVHVFRTGVEQTAFASCADADMGSTLPTVICEAVDPVVLSASVESAPAREECGCGEIPESVLSCLSGCLCGREEEKTLCVSLGFFSVLRIERPCQCLVSATEYNVPDKVCTSGNCPTPCEQFEKMNFPVSEFNTGAGFDGGCGCGR